jgi:hypothetical protein
MAGTYTLVISGKSSGGNVMTTSILQIELTILDPCEVSGGLTVDTS